MHHVNYKKHAPILGMVLGVACVVCIGVLGYVLTTIHATQQELVRAINDLWTQSESQREQLLLVAQTVNALDETQGKLASTVNVLEEGTGLAQETLATLQTSIETERQQEESQDITNVVKAWDDRIARVSCVLVESDGDASRAVASGVAVYFGQNLYVMTNKHVLEEDGETLAGCEIEFPQHNIDDIEVNPRNILISNDRDIAYLRVTDSVSLPVDRSQNACTVVPDRGDRVITLGYPRVGAEESITVTDGIISGIEDDFYITSAKIEQGNSGGAAILPEQNCFIGIPTLVVVGRIESLARILSVDSLQQLDL